MDTAISMTMGGTRVTATDIRLKSASYWELGLCCPSCCEPVYWKSGGVVTPHFAHFPGTPASQACSLRMEGSSSSYGYGSSQSFQDVTILLKDVHTELIKILLSHNKAFDLRNINIAPRDEIKPDEIEQNILNLLLFNKMKNLEILDSYFKRIDHYKAPKHILPIIKNISLRETNRSISREMLNFITAPGNKSILYTVISFHRTGQMDPGVIQRVRKKIIEDIAIKNWYIILHFPEFRKKQELISAHII